MSFSVRNHPFLSKTHKLTANIELADADHNPVVLSLLSGIPKTGTYIQLSGAASISDSSNGLGQPTTKK